MEASFWDRREVNREIMNRTRCDMRGIVVKPQEAAISCTLRCMGSRMTSAVECLLEINLPSIDEQIDGHVRSSMCEEGIEQQSRRNQPRRLAIVNTMRKATT